MDLFDQELTKLTEKELLILNLRSQSRLLNKLVRLEQMADLIQKHLLPKDAEHYIKDTGNTCGSYIDLLQHSSMTDCGQEYNHKEIDESVQKAIEEIQGFHSRFHQD